MSQITHVCLLGFGEVGQTLAEDLARKEAALSDMLDAILGTLNDPADLQGTPTR